MTTYRASLGTRGELRRIAAEAETATIERVRPWRRQVQPCNLAPHVIVPQWIRSELPPKAPSPPPPPPTGREVVASLIESLIDDVCKNTPPTRRATTRQDTEKAHAKQDLQVEAAKTDEPDADQDKELETPGGNGPPPIAAADSVQPVANVEEPVVHEQSSEPAAHAQDTQDVVPELADTDADAMEIDAAAATAAAAIPEINEEESGGLQM